MGISVRDFGELAEWTWGSGPCVRRFFGDLRLLFWGSLALPPASARRLGRIGAPGKLFGTPKPAVATPTRRAGAVNPQKFSQLAVRRAPDPQKVSQPNA